jgi:ferric-chelate reductase (NADPH)
MSSGSPPDGSQERDGRFSRLMRRWFLEHVRADVVEDLAPHFRLVSFSGPELKGKSCAPGDKMQIIVGPNLLRRTYTPFAWDSEKGRAQFLGYVHGETPACSWLKALRAGDAFEFLGPRTSLDVAALGPEAVLFGDETCIGLALALRRDAGATGASIILEVSDVKECRQVCEALSLPNTVLIQRAEGDVHVREIEQELRRLAQSGANFVLGGKATSIQTAKRELRAAGVPTSRTRALAYWAPGKEGLD